MLPDIRNPFNTSFYLPIFTASSVVDTLGLFVWRYTSEPTAPINKWYDEFGLAAYTADILSIMLGLVLTQLVSVWIGGPWNPAIFCALSVVVQLAHDLFFGNVVVPLFPKGHNRVMDLMKEYVKIKFPAGILIVDAIYMISASLLTMLFVKLGSFATWFTLLWTIYIGMYAIYTKP
jgi:hypothetical protein